MMVMLPRPPQPRQRQADVLGRRRQRVPQRVERHAGRPGEWRAHQRDGAKNVRPDQRRPGGDGGAEIMPDDGGNRLVTEGMDQANGISGQVDRAPRRQVLVIGHRPAGSPAVATKVGGNDIIPGIGQSRHDTAPGIGNLGEAMQQQQAWSAMRTSLQDMHSKPVHTRHEPGAHALGQNGGVERRQDRGHCGRLLRFVSPRERRQQTVSPEGERDQAAAARKACIIARHAVARRNLLAQPQFCCSPSSVLIKVTRPFPRYGTVDFRDFV